MSFSIGVTRIFVILYCAACPIFLSHLKIIEYLVVFKVKTASA